MLAYFLTLSSEAHSEAWTPVLLLLFTQMEKLQVKERSKFWISKVTHVSPLQEERLRRFAAAVYPLLCQLWCADLRPEVVIASCQRWSNTRDKINVFVLFRCAVCSALCFCGSVLSMAFQTSPMGLGMQRCSILSFSFWYQFSSISSPGGQCSILMQRPEDNLSSIVI